MLVFENKRGGVSYTLYYTVVTGNSLVYLSYRRRVLLKKIFLFIALFMFVQRSVSSQVVINEIMYHDLDSDLEYVELYNAGTMSVDLSGWQLRDDREVNEFFIPAGITISSHGYVIIADDTDLFKQKYGFLPTIGGLSFNLSNASDEVQLFDAEGIIVEIISYTDRTPWPEAADGEGSSLERLNALFPSNLPESWAASSPGGTPGKINSAHIDELYPIIRSVDHNPKIPAPFESVTVTAQIVNVVGNIDSVRLFYGQDNETQYKTVDMLDDGLHGDCDANDQIFGASIEGASARTVLCFYVEATNDSGLVTLMPKEGKGRPYLTVFESPLGNENVSVFRVAMQPAVQQQFLARYQTDEYFPATFYDGDEVYYQIDIRHRGRSRSQNGRFKIQFPYDRLFRGKIRRLNFNGTDTATILNEFLSYQIYQDAGLPNLETELVRFHINGEATRGTPYRISIENPDSQFIRRGIFFDNDNGNLYKTTLDGTPANKATWRYIGDDPDLYRYCYIKQTNESEDDFSDIIQFCKILTESEPEDADFAGKVKSVLNVEEFLRWMAVSAIVAHWDSPYTDHGQNYVLYNDPDTMQFNIIAWDLNGTFNYSSNKDDLNYRKLYTHIRGTKLPAINKILNHPEFGAYYYQEIDYLLDTLFTENAMNQRIENARKAIQTGSNSVSYLRTYVTNRIRDLSDWINRDQGMTLLSKPVYQIAVNEPYRYHAVAVDYRNYRSITYRLVSAPDWIEIGSETGIISGVPTQEGVYSISLEAKNSSGVTVTQQYELQVVDLQPRLIVNFNEEDGSVVDSSPFQHTGVLRRGASRTDGALGNGVSLSDQNAYIEFPHDDSMNLTGSITIEAWIKPDQISNGNPIILTKGNEDQFNYCLMLGYGPWNWDAMEPCFMPHRFDIENRVYYGRKEIEAQLRNQQWVHIAGTYDSAIERVKVYSNNYQIVDSSSRPQMVTNRQPLIVGLNGNRRFQGVVDTIRILPYAKQAFAAGLCLSQVDVSGLSSAQDRIALSLSELRDKPVNVGDFCIHLVRSDHWISLPDRELEPGKSVTMWWDDLGINEPLPSSETMALYPKNTLGTAAREWVLDQIVWGDNVPNAFDPGVQAAVWLPGCSVPIPNGEPVTLALKQFANNDDMETDWSAGPQRLTGPIVTSFQINDGSELIGDTNVQLTIEMENIYSSLQIRISNSADLGQKWIPYSNTVSWSLTSGDGAKTVYLQVKDSKDMRSQVVTSTINVNTGTGVKNWAVHH